jgi:L-methionine (R)-S-oxide reductase
MGNVSPATDHAGWLLKFVERHGGVSGTIHLLEGEILTLSAALNIPPHVRDLVAQSPRGKGMAGLAWERDEPVVTCNLKEDNSGNVRTGAKAVNAGSGIALPVRDSRHKIRAIVGIAFKDPQELSQTQIHTLLSDAATLP